MRSLYLVAIFCLIEISIQDRNLQIINTSDEYSPVSLRQCVKHFYLPSHITRSLVPGYQEFTLVYKDITCKFRILMRERDGEQHYNYRAGAYSGVPSEEEKLVVRDCAIFTCTGESIDTCGKRFMPYTKNSTALFDELFIEGTVPVSLMNPKITYNSSSLLNPSTLNLALQPLEIQNYKFSAEEKDDNTIHKLSLKNPEVELFIFAMWGSQFDRDQNVTPATEDVEKKKYAEEKDGVDDEKIKVNNDEKEETQEDNDEGIVKNFKSFMNL